MGDRVYSRRALVVQFAEPVEDGCPTIPTEDEEQEHAGHLNDIYERNTLRPDDVLVGWLNLDAAAQEQDWRSFPTNEQIRAHAQTLDKYFGMWLHIGRGSPAEHVLLAVDENNNVDERWAEGKPCGETRGGLWRPVNYRSESAPWPKAAR